METWQIAVLGGAAALIVAIELLPKLWTKLTKSAVKDANAVTAAYRLLEPYLTPETAHDVRAQVAEGFLPIPKVEPKAETPHFNVQDLIDALTKVKS